MAFFRREGIRGLFCGVERADFLNSQQGEVGVEVVDFGESGSDEGGVASGGVDGGGLGEFFSEGGENFADESAIADDGADLHGVFGGFADGAGGLREVDAGEESGALMKVVAESSEAGGDDTTEIGAALGSGDDVEGDGGAKVDHDGGLGQRGDGGGIGETVGADLMGERIVDRDGELAEMADLMGGDVSVGEGLGEEGGFLGNDGADGCVRDRLGGEALLDGIGSQLSGGKDGTPVEESGAVRESELGARVGVVDEEVDVQGDKLKRAGGKEKATGCPVAFECYELQ